MTPDSLTISYRVKDILDEINAKLDVALEQLEKKASNEAVLALALRVAALEVRASIEDDRHAQAAAVFTRREKIVGICVALLTVVINTLLRYIH